MLQINRQLKILQKISCPCFQTLFSVVENDIKLPFSRSLNFGIVKLILCIRSLTIIEVALIAIPDKTLLKVTSASEGTTIIRTGGKTMAIILVPAALIQICNVRKIPCLVTAITAAINSLITVFIRLNAALE